MVCTGHRQEAWPEGDRRDIDDTKIPLALVEGATENATVVGNLLVGLRERGLDTTRPILVMIDGAKARRAVLDVFDHPRHPTLPTPQAPQRHRPAPGCAGLDFPHATQAIRITRRVRPLTGRKWRTVTAYAVTN